jgi:hypothetical protein
VLNNLVYKGWYQDQVVCAGAGAIGRRPDGVGREPRKQASQGDSLEEDNGSLSVQIIYNLQSIIISTMLSTIE